MKKILIVVLIVIFMIEVATIISLVNRNRKNNPTYNYNNDVSNDEKVDSGEPIVEDIFASTIDEMKKLEKEKQDFIEGLEKSQNPETIIFNESSGHLIYIFKSKLDFSEEYDVQLLTKESGEDYKVISGDISLNRKPISVCTINGNGLYSDSNFKFIMFKDDTFGLYNPANKIVTSIPRKALEYTALRNYLNGEYVIDNIKRDGFKAYDSEIEAIGLNRIKILHDMMYMYYKDSIKDKNPVFTLFEKINFEKNIISMEDKELNPELGRIYAITYEINQRKVNETSITIYTENGYTIKAHKESIDATEFDDRMKNYYSDDIAWYFNGYVPEYLDE